MRACPLGVRDGGAGWLAAARDGADIGPRLMVGSSVSSPCMGDYDVEHSHGMHVVHDGPRQAPPLLLIHGSGASGALGARWSGHSPATITSSGSTFRGAANPRPHRHTTYLSRQAAWLCCSTISGCGTSLWPGTPAAATSQPHSPNSGPTRW